MQSHMYLGIIGDGDINGRKVVLKGKKSVQGEKPCASRKERDWPDELLSLQQIPKLFALANIGLLCLAVEI